MDYLKDLSEYVDDFENEIENIKQLSELISDFKTSAKSLEELKEKLTHISTKIESDVNNTEYIKNIDNLKRNIKEENRKLKENVDYIFGQKFEEFSLSLSNIQINDEVIKKQLLGAFKKDISESIDISKNIERNLSGQILEISENENKENEIKYENLKNNINLITEIISDTKNDIEKNRDMSNTRIIKNIDELEYSIKQENNNITKQLDSVLNENFQGLDMKISSLEESDKKANKNLRENLESILTHNASVVDECMSNITSSNHEIQTKLKLLDILKENIERNIMISENIEYKLTDKFVKLFEQHEEKFELKINNLKSDIKSINNMTNEIKESIEKVGNKNNKDNKINRAIIIIGYILIVLFIYLN